MQLNLTNRLSRFLQWLWRQEGSPGYKARGLAIGVFCGCFPLFGFQTILGILLVSVFRGNYLLAVAGTWISNPLTYLPLYWFNYLVGCALLGDSQKFNHVNQFAWKGLFNQGWIFGGRLFLGSACVGVFGGLFLGLVLYVYLKLRLRKDNSPHANWY